MKNFFVCLIVFFCFWGAMAYANPLDDGNPIVLCPGPNPVFQLPSGFQPKSWNMEINGASIPSFVCDGKIGLYFFSTTRALPAGVNFKMLVAGTTGDEFHGEGIIGPTKELAMGKFSWYSLFERGKSKIFPLNGQCGVNTRTGIDAYCEKDEKVFFRLVELGSGQELKVENALKFQLSSGQWAACMSPLLGKGEIDRTFFRPGETYRVECRKSSGNLYWYFSTAGPDKIGAPPEKI